MKINLLITALVAILGLAFAGAPLTAQAQTTNTSSATAPTPTKDKKAAKTPYSGSITAIDASSVTVDGKKTLTLAIAPSTTFKKDGKTATLADFAVGDKVTGSYSKDSTGAMTACSIHKKASKTSSKTTPTPAASTSTTTSTPAAQ